MAGVRGVERGVGPLFDVEPPAEGEPDLGVGEVVEGIRSEQHVPEVARLDDGQGVGPRGLEWQDRWQKAESAKEETVV